jgi:hypothetical protein
MKATLTSSLVKGETMTTQLFTDQRGTAQHLITRIEVERAWADSVGAADMYERNPNGYTRRKMLEATDNAERLQAWYDEQQDDLSNKRVMLINVNGDQRLNPAWCKHEHITDIMLPGDPSGSVWVCKDCGAYLTDDGQVDHIPTDEIEF